MRRLLFYADLVQALGVYLRVLLAPKNRPVVIGLFVRKRDCKLLSRAVCPEGVFVGVNPRRSRGWDEIAFSRLMSFFARAAGKRPVRPIVWGYRDRRDHGIDVDRYFSDYWRVERALVGPPGASRAAFIVGDRSIYFDGRVSTEIERRLNQLTPGELPQSEDGQRLLGHILSSSLTKYASTVQAGRVPTGRDLLILGQVSGDQAIAQTESLAQDNCGLLDVVAQRVLAGGRFENVYFKPHPKNSTTADDLAYLRAHHPGISVIDGETGIIPLLAGRPTVATLTSAAGLEAALRGCTVHVLGIPFYSHWGFTVDHLPCSRRTNRLSPEDVFLFMLMRHTRYVDPRTRRAVTALEAFGLTSGQAPSRAGSPPSSLATADALRPHRTPAGS